MADYQIKLDTGNNYTVSQEKTVVAEFLSDLADVSVSNLPAKDNYVMTYNATLGKYVLVPADQVLQTAAADAELPQQFVQQLDIELDNKVDLDAGTF